jgi:hypothetical protein
MRGRSKFNPIPRDIGDYIAYSEESSTWLVNKVKRKGGSRAGKEIGSISSSGYLHFKFNQVYYSNHRVIYFLCTGIDPEEKQIDHIDGNKLNNKISNLRLANHRQNSFNRKKRKDNTSGITGVVWNKDRKKWMSKIENGGFKNLGYFNSFDEAVAVRMAAETDPRFKDQEFRNPHNDEHTPSPEMLEWAKQYLEDRIERLNWKEKYNV